MRALEDALRLFRELRVKNFSSVAKGLNTSRRGIGKKALKLEKNSEIRGSSKVLTCWAVPSSWAAQVLEMSPKFQGAGVAGACRSRPGYSCDGAPRLSKASSDVIRL